MAAKPYKNCLYIFLPFHPLTTSSRLLQSGFSITFCQTAIVLEMDKPSVFMSALFLDLSAVLEADVQFSLLVTSKTWHSPDDTVIFQ